MASRFARLTPQAISQLSIGEKIREHRIKVEKLAGDEKWSAEFMHHGERVHRVIGLSSGGWTRTKCEAWVLDEIAKLGSGHSSLPKGRKTQLRISELADWYLRIMEETGGRNVPTKHRQLTGRLVPELGRIICEKLTRDDVSRYSKRQLEAGLSAATVNRDLATLSHMLNTAVNSKKLNRLPCRAPRLREHLGRTRILTDDEIGRLRTAAAADVNPDLWLFVEFGLNTCMRHSEIINTRFEDVDWEHQRIFLPKAKGGARQQPATPDLIDLIKKDAKARGQHEGWIFPVRKNQSKSGRAYSFSSQFERAVIAAGMKPHDVTPHVMRHTAITRLVQAGVPLPTVQLITGHKTLIMLKRYTHISDPYVDSGLDALSASLPRRA